MVRPRADRLDCSVEGVAIHGDDVAARKRTDRRKSSLSERLARQIIASVVTRNDADSVGWGFGAEPTERLGYRQAPLLRFSCTICQPRTPRRKTEAPRPVPDAGSPSMKPVQLNLNTHAAASAEWTNQTTSETS